MNTFAVFRWLLAPLLAAVLQLPTLRADARAIRTQSLQLREGWNAIFLEVEPLEVAPDTVFDSVPVDVVARFFVPSSPVQFISDPADAPWNQPSWGVWYAKARPDAFLTSLHAIQGFKAYLVHATANCTWQITGRAVFPRIRWQADSFNLCGFSVDEQAPPTFERFFAGSGGKIGRRIYRLGSGGKWQPVSAPATTAMRSGEAYWIYCEGETDYQGPLEVTIPGLGELDFGDGTGALQVGLLNRSSEPDSISIERVPGGGDLPLVQVRRDLPTLQTSYPDLPSFTSLPDLPPGQMSHLGLRVKREAMTLNEQGCLLKFTSRQGVLFWVPVRARSAELAGQP